MFDFELARLLWDYLAVNDILQPSDAILCLGSHDTSVAAYAADLYKQQLAPYILFSGGLGRFTKNSFEKSEAETFGDIARQAGISESAILLENKSSNSGENILFSTQLIKEKGINVERLILVHKPYMERRALATLQAQWPEPQPRVLSTGPQVSFKEYCHTIPESQVINIMVGDLQRIREYPKRGFQTEQYIPPKVWDAWTELVKRGYTQQLLK